MIGPSQRFDAVESSIDAYRIALAAYQEAPEEPEDAEEDSEATKTIAANLLKFTEELASEVDKLVDYIKDAHGYLWKSN